MSGGRVNAKPPLVEPGWRIEEVVVCNIATEPVARIEIPDGGTLIVHWKESPAEGWGRRKGKGRKERRRKEHA